MTDPDRQRDEIEIQIPGGWRGFFRGNQAVCALVLCLVAALVVYLDDRTGKKVEALIEAQAAVRKEVRENTESQQVMIYVLTLSQAEKEKLNLMRPRKLTEMQR